MSKLANFSEKSLFAKTSDLAFLEKYTSPITNDTEQVEKVTSSGKDTARALANVFAKTYGELFDTSTGSFDIWSASGMLCLILIVYCY